jgi:hypothetical protein
MIDAADCWPCDVDKLDGVTKFRTQDFRDAAPSSRSRDYHLMLPEDAERGVELGPGMTQKQLETTRRLPQQ